MCHKLCPTSTLIKILSKTSLKYQKMKYKNSPDKSTLFGLSTSYNQV